MCQERERMEPLTRLRWKSHVYCTGVPFFLADVLAMVMGRRAPARGLDSNHASPRELGDLLTKEPGCQEGANLLVSRLREHEAQDAQVFGPAYAGLRRCRLDPFAKTIGELDRDVVHLGTARLTLHLRRHGPY